MYYRKETPRYQRYGSHVGLLEDFTQPKPEEPSTGPFVMEFHNQIENMLTVGERDFGQHPNPRHTDMLTNNISIRSPIKDSSTDAVETIGVEECRRVFHHRALTPTGFSFLQRTDKSIH